MTDVKRLLCVNCSIGAFLLLNGLRTNGSDLEIVPGVHDQHTLKLITNPRVTIRLDRAVIAEGSNASLGDQVSQSRIRDMFANSEIDGALVVHHPDGSSQTTVRSIPSELRRKVVVLLEKRDPAVLEEYKALGIIDVQFSSQGERALASVRNVMSWF